jgi:carboxypeptidase C (cathepsin A)
MVAMLGPLNCNGQDRTNSTSNRSWIGEHHLVSLNREIYHQFHDPYFFCRKLPNSSATVGHYKQYNGFTFLEIENAGHMVSL